MHPNDRLKEVELQNQLDNLLFNTNLNTFRKQLTKENAGPIIKQIDKVMAQANVLYNNKETPLSH